MLKITKKVLMILVLMSAPSFAADYLSNTTFYRDKTIYYVPDYSGASRMQQRDVPDNVYGYNHTRQNVVPLDNDFVDGTIDESKRERYHHIAKHVASAKRKLAKVQEQIDAFSGSFFTRTIAKCRGGLESKYSKRELKALAARCEKHIKHLEAGMQDCKIKDHFGIVGVAQIPNGLPDQHSFYHKYGLSQDAQALIVNTHIGLVQFEKLAMHKQQEIVALLNRAAREQKNITDQSCVNAIKTTAKIADSACQAYQKGYHDLGSALIDFGNTFIDCTVAFSKGLVHGVVNEIQHKLDNPMKALESVAICVIAMAALPLVPVSSVVMLSVGVTAALVDITQKVSGLPLIQACQKVGEITGGFAADGVIINNTLKATSAVTKVVVGETVGLMKRAAQELSAIGQVAKAEITAVAESETVLVRTAEGFEVAVNAKAADIAKAIEVQAQRLEMNAVDAAKNGVKSEVAGATVKPVEWTAHGHKHVSPKNVSWKEIAKNTKNGAAKYLPEINIEKLERYAWENGIPTTNGKPWKVIDNKTVIGASDGIETQYMRIENSANMIHGHPITFEEYRRLIK